MPGDRMSSSPVLLAAVLMTVTSAADARLGPAARLLKVPDILSHGDGTGLKTMALGDILGQSATVFPNGCQCSSQTKSCGCCASINLPRIKVSSKVCANLSYDAFKGEIHFTLSWNDWVIIHKVFSVKSPPVLCVPVPVSHVPKLCIVFYGFEWGNKTITGSARLRITILGKDIDFFDLGCFSFGPFGQHLHDDLSSGFLQTLAEVAESRVTAQRMEEAEEEDDKEEDDKEEGIPLAPSGCQCLRASKVCSCCSTITDLTSKLGLHLCANITYDPYLVGVRFTLTADGRTISQHTVTGKDADKRCVRVPGVPTGRLCVHFYGFGWTDVLVTGCLRVRASLRGREVAGVSLGCFALDAFSQTVSQDVSAQGLKLLAAMVAVETAVRENGNGWKAAAAAAARSGSVLCGGPAPRCTRRHV